MKDTKPGLKDPYRVVPNLNTCTLPFSRDRSMCTRKKWTGRLLRPKPRRESQRVSLYLCMADEDVLSFSFGLPAQQSERTPSKDPYMCSRHAPPVLHAPPQSIVSWGMELNRRRMHRARSDRAGPSHSCQRPTDTLPIISVFYFGFMHAPSPSPMGRPT